MEQKTSVIKIILKYVGKFKGRITVSALLLIMARLLAVADPYVIKSLIDNLVAGADFSVLIIFVIAFFVLRWGTDIFDGMKDYVFAKAETNIKRLIALDVFKHLMNLSVDFHTNRSTGGVARKIARGSSGLEMALFFFVANILPTFIEIVLVIAIFVNLFPISFAIVIFIFVFTYVVYTIYTNEKRQKVLLESNLKDDEASSKSIDAIMNYETVKYFNNEPHEYKQYGDRLAEWVNIDIRATKVGANLNMGQGFIITIGVTSLLILAILEYMKGAATIGDFVLVTTYIARIATPLTFLGFTYRRVKEGLADTDEMLKLLHIKNTVKDNPNATALENVEGLIEFKNVGFGYTSNRTVIHNMSFTCEAKKRTALVGYSGSGKSTISKLLLRFYDVKTGNVLVDGRDVRDITQESLRHRIGVVAQDTILFNDTILSNIAYGKPEATREEIEEAAKVANIHDFITNELPANYDTVVGERGVKLSGGEKQRVAIARMILKNPSILLFDEATASLDSKAEKNIQESIEKISQEGRTTIVIAHRLSTIVHFDKIVVLKKGHVVEQGTHDNLLAQKGVYYNLWNAQSKKQNDIT